MTSTAPAKNEQLFNLFTKVLMLFQFFFPQCLDDLHKRKKMDGLRTKHKKTNYSHMALHPTYLCDVLASLTAPFRLCTKHKTLNKIGT